MLRKMVIPFALLSFSTTCFSAGFYMGAGLGPDFTNFDQTAYITQSSTGPGPIFQGFNVKDSTHHAGKGFFGGLFGGYAWTRQQFYLAGEVDFNLSSDEFKSSNNEFIHPTLSSTSYQMQYNLSLSALPGYLFTNTILFYGRLGYANGNFKTSTTDISLANVNRHLNGFIYGLGVQQGLSQHLAVRMEYDQIIYQNTRFSTFDGLSNTSKNTTIQPTTNQVEFGLVYNFA